VSAAASVFQYRVTREVTVMKDRKSERIEFLSSNDEQRELYDLSETGVGCYSSMNLEPGTVVSITIGNETLEAKVVYCRDHKPGYRLGMQFWKVSAEKKQKVKKLVDDFSRGVPLSCRLEEVSSGQNKK
jgi:hypothetical protein